MSQRPSRALLLRWGGWFAACNAVIAMLIGLRYLSVYVFPEELSGKIYALVATVGHFAALGGVAILLLIVPLVLLFPRQRLVQAVCVLLAAAGLSLLVLDTNLFSQNRFHLSRLNLELFESSTWILTAIVFCTLLMFQSVMAGSIWTLVNKRPRLGGAWVTAGLAICWLTSQGLNIWGDAYGHTAVTQFNRFLPVYYPIHAKRTLTRMGLLDPERVRQSQMVRRASRGNTGQLNYPLNALQCTEEPDNLPNLLIVVIDALRPDLVDEIHTPRLAAFAAESQWFMNHYSGGNSSRMGNFSLFYGLPTTYWDDFYNAQRSPVLMDQVLAHGYEMALFSAVGWGSPTLMDRTTLANVPVLQSGEPEGDRNDWVTRQWQEWLTARDDGQRFFGILYYDPAMGKTDLAAEGLAPDNRYADAEESIRLRWAEYRAAMRATDRQLGRALDALDQAGLADETVVIIYSDHGYEFDDSGQGYLGHASSFSRYQLSSVLGIRWPGRPPRQWDHRSAHQDVPVTLLQEVFGCSNSADDFSSGQSLFAGEDWDWLIAGSYSAHAIVQPAQVVVTRPGGLVEILDGEYRPLSDAELDASLLEAAIAEMRRFYR